MTVDPGVLSLTTAATLKACIDGICQSQTFTPPRTPTMFVPTSPVKSGEVTVSVSLSAGTRQAFSGSAKTRTFRVQPNGHGCDPTVWQAKVTARANGQLTD